MKLELRKRKMYNLKIVVLIILIINGVAALAKVDSVGVNQGESKTFFKKQILPVSLIATGSLLNIGTFKFDIQDRILDTNTAADDYFQYTPMAQMYVYDALGFKHANCVFNQTKYLLISQLTSSILVHFLKQTTKVPRPLGQRTAFPSGHTTNAFVGATMLYHEFKDTEPLLAYSGFLFAVSTGALRMTNDAHWLSDVLAGAGIGILTVNLVYYIKPFENFQPFKNKHISMIPTLGLNRAGFICQF